MPNLDYVCIDSKIRELEPWYLNGTLDQKDKKVFENHLKICPRCAEDFSIDKMIFEAIKHDASVSQTTKELKLAAAETKRKKKPLPELIAHEDITINFEEADTKIKLIGYLTLYCSGELFVNFIDIGSTTEKYDKTKMRIIMPTYAISSAPLNIKHLKENLGEYILVGNIRSTEEVDLALMKKDIRMEPISRKQSA